MGMFSYMCGKTGRQIVEDAPSVVIYYMVSGQVMEVMSGPYNGYGGVEVENQLVHLVRLGTELTPAGTPSTPPSDSTKLWLYDDWGDMVSAYLNDDETTGFHAIIGEYDPTYVPDVISEDDPNQGWEYNDGDEE
jgi:hypothetical protein